MTNEEMVGRAGENRRVLDIISGRNRNYLGHYMRQTQDNVMIETLEGLINGKRNRGQMMDDLRMQHQETKRLA